MICGHGHGQKFKYPYSGESKIIQMPYPRAKAIDQIPALCPASPPPPPSLRRLDNKCNLTKGKQGKQSVLFTEHYILGI